MLNILGYLAAFFTTISFVPQAYKIIKTKDTTSISLIMYFMFSLGVLLWFIYGIWVNAAPIYIANGITFILAFIILIMKINNK